jgi:hypothetical protein
LSGSRQQRWTCRCVQPAGNAAVDKQNEQWLPLHWRVHLMYILACTLLCVHSFFRS